MIDVVRQARERGLGAHENEHQTPSLCDGGRPRWGKIHFQDAASLAALYPKFHDFTAVRDRLDPDHLFMNPYLDRVLGT